MTIYPRKYPLNKTEILIKYILRKHMVSKFKHIREQTLFKFKKEKNG